jgi:hypothetical protein
VHVKTEALNRWSYQWDKCHILFVDYVKNRENFSVIPCSLIYTSKEGNKCNTPSDVM